ncbi:MAG: type II toxin-antitoxin system RelE family toxin [Rhizobiaceae bacterium]
MVWRIEFQESAKKDLAKLDRQVAKRITVFLRERVVSLENPRMLGAALTGSRLGEFWKYRVGDYRVLCRLEDDVMRVLVITVGNRRDVYR